MKKMLKVSSSPKIESDVKDLSKKTDSSIDEKGPVVIETEPKEEHTTKCSSSILEIKDNKDHWVIIFEVTFLETENKLSSVAIINSKKVLFDKVQSKAFSRSVRKGLRKVLEAAGFRMTNSRSAYYTDSLYPHIQQIGLLYYLKNFKCKKRVDLVRAKFWLLVVLKALERDPTMTEYPSSHENDRKCNTPFLVLRNGIRFV